MVWKLYLNEKKHKNRLKQWLEARGPGKPPRFCVGDADDKSGSEFPGSQSEKGNESSYPSPSVLEIKISFLHREDSAAPPRTEVFKDSCIVSL